MKTVQRLLFIAFIGWIIAIRMPILLVYEAVFFASYEYLNHNKKYTALPSHQFYNWLFVAFVGFVLLVRSKWLTTSEAAEYHLNTAEHLFFACVVCLTLSIYFYVSGLFPRQSFFMLAAVFLGFNLIGLLNEFFQNLFQQAPVFMLQENDTKDLCVNLTGSGVYIFFICIFKLKK